MSSTPEPQSHWRRRALFGVVLVPLAITFLVSGTASQPAAIASGQSSPAPAAVEGSAQVEAELPLCPPEEIAITSADIGNGQPGRCLPIGGDEVQGSRVDPLYGRVATGLFERISGRPAPFVGGVKVICWSKDDWLELSAAFRDAGKMERLTYWLGWARGERGVVNLSYPVCKHLDAIAYRKGRLALPATGAAVGTLAHETMHVAGIDDEGITDCYAMQLTAVTALGLGAADDYADQLRILNFEFNLENRAGTEYDSPDCYDGGPLDLEPESSRWP